MCSLFPAEPNYPEGFSYFEKFLSKDEQKRLLEAVLSVDLHTFLFQGYEAKRKVESFGYDYNFTTRAITRGKAIPGQFDFIIEKVAAFLSIPGIDFAELLVTEYPPGSVINWHRDAPPFGIIAGISLLAECNFRFRPYDKARQGRKSIVSLRVAPGSLYVIKAEARSEWEHSISPVKEKRYSVTLRTLRS